MIVNWSDRHTYYVLYFWLVVIYIRLLVSYFDFSNLLNSRNISSFSDFLGINFLLSSSLSLFFDVCIPFHFFYAALLPTQSTFVPAKPHHVRCPDSDLKTPSLLSFVESPSSPSGWRMQYANMSRLVALLRSHEIREKALRIRGKSRTDVRICEIIIRICMLNYNCK